MASLQGQQEIMTEEANHTRAPTNHPDKNLRDVKPEQNNTIMHVELKNPPHNPPIKKNKIEFKIMNTSKFYSSSKLICTQQLCVLRRSIIISSYIYNTSSSKG